MTNMQMKNALAEAVRKLPDKSAVILLVAPVGTYEAGQHFPVEVATNMGKDTTMRILSMLSEQEVDISKN